MRRCIVFLLMLVFVLSCGIGCVAPGVIQTEATDTSKADAPAGGGKETQPTATPAPKDPVTEAFEEGRYLDAIEAYEDALRDPSASLTEAMKEAYAASFDRYVEAACSKAELAFGDTKDYDAAVQVLQGAIDAAGSRAAITDPLNAKRDEYVMDKNQAYVDEAYQAGKYLEAIRRYEALETAGETMTEQMTSQYWACFDDYVEAVFAEAEKACGTNRNYDAAIQVLDRAMEEAFEYTGITFTLGSKKVEYETMRCEADMDEAFQAGKYLEAAMQYERTWGSNVPVTPQMTQQYQDCFVKYVAKAFAEAEKAFGIAKDYDAAIRVLNEYSNDAYMYYQVSEELENKVHEYLAGKYASLVDKAYKAGNYLEAARKYLEAAQYPAAELTTKDMKKQYDDSVSKYVKKISDNAQQAFGKDKNYNAAIKVVHNAIAGATDIPDIVASLEEKVAYFAAYEPIALTSLSWVQKTDFLQRATESYWVGSAMNSENIIPDLIRDVNKTNYNKETVFFSRPYRLESPEANDSYVVYNLNYEYSSFSGVVYRPYIALSCDHKWNIPGKVQIYGDDVLIWESPDITMETYDAYPFTLDVSGIRNIKIIINGLWENYYPKVCVGNLMLQK